MHALFKIGCQTCFLDYINRHNFPDGIHRLVGMSIEPWNEPMTICPPCGHYATELYRNFLLFSLPKVT